MELHDSLKVSSVCSYCVHLFLELIKKKNCTTNFPLFACTDLKIKPHCVLHQVPFYSRASHFHPETHAR